MAQQTRQIAYRIIDAGDEHCEGRKGPGGHFYPLPVEQYEKTDHHTDEQGIEVDPLTKMSVIPTEGNVNPNAK